MDFKYIPSYEECLNITTDNTNFVAKREMLDSIPIVSFGYRLASIEDFVKFKGARNLRGITFREDTKELVALPFHKFWNLNENDYSKMDRFKDKKILRVTEKYDGSLVYFFTIEDKLYCKTKFDTFSIQAVRALEIVKNDKSLSDNIKQLVCENYTPLFEFISPKNQVVVLYGEEKLKYICSRSMVNGTYNFNLFNGCDPVDEISIDTIQSTVSAAKNYYGHEGFVVTFEDHDMIKIKTEEYFKLHKIRANVLNESFLVNLILNEDLDDIKSTLFSTDVSVLDYINSLEKKVVTAYNTLIQHAEFFYNSNKELSRKDYALSAQKELNRISFSLAMEMYNKGRIDEGKFKEKFVAKRLWID